jgi:hypothetical protein
MGDYEGGMGCKGSQHLSGSTIFEVIKAASQRLAVQRDATLARLCARCLKQRGMLAKDGLDVGGIEPLQDVADRGARRQVRPKNAISLQRCTSIKVTIPQ